MRIRVIFQKIFAPMKAMLGFRSHTERTGTGQAARRGVHVTSSGERSVTFFGIQFGGIFTGDRISRDSKPAGVQALLSHASFTARTAHIALSSHEGELVGRSQHLASLQTALEKPCRLVLVYGPGGMGKTRLLLALPELVPQQASLWYVPQEARAEAIAQAISNLEGEQQQVIVADDFHRFTVEQQQQLRELLVTPVRAGRVTLVISSRGVFKDMVLDVFPPLPDDEVLTIEVEPLTAPEIDTLLQGHTGAIVDMESRHIS